jgi:hypothetical protein
MKDGVLSQMKERGFVHVPIIDQDSKPAGAIMSQASDNVDRRRGVTPREG